MPIPIERLALAKKRIKSVLLVRFYATTRQLESKISEGGPTPQRCDPHVISQALREMVADNEIKVVTHPVHNNRFFYLPELELKAKSRKALALRRKNIDELYSQYIQLAKSDSRICGDALETVVRNAFKDAQGFYEIGSKEHPVLTFGGRTISGALDGTYLLSGKQILIAVEAKNIREWIYPSSEELWSLIHKANTISSDSCRVLPVIICRKIPYYAFAAFKQIGLLGFEVHNQFFDPSVADCLTDIKHKDGLGFHDIKTELVYPPKLLSFLTETVNNYGAEYASKFLENKPLFDKCAPALSSNSVRGSYRTAIWNSIKNALNLTTSISDHE